MPLVRTLRTLLTNNIPEILPEIRMSISGLFDQMHDSHPVVKGEHSGKTAETATDRLFRCQGLSVVFNGVRSCRLF